MIKNVTIGSDPEVFLIDENNEFVPAIGLIGGTKEEPKRISNNGHAVQEDNVMAEFNVPYTTLNNPAKLYADIQYVLTYLKNLVAPKGYKLAVVPSAFFNWDHLKTEQARMFGCDPDFNAWTAEENVIDRVETNLRTAGGHIHIGYENPDVVTSMELIKILDLYLGVASILLDTDTDRRKLYGKAGCFRFTSFGVEYRVLSNFWIDSEQNLHWVFENIQKAIEAFNSGFRINPGSELEDEIINTINSQNSYSALELSTKYSLIPETLLVELNK